MGDFTTYLPYLPYIYNGTYFTKYLPYMFHIFPWYSHIYEDSLGFAMFDAGDFLVASQAIDFTLPEESYLSRIEVGNSEDICDIPICTFTHTIYTYIIIYILCVCSYIISKNLTLYLYLYIISWGKFHRYERELYFGMCSLSLSTCLFNVLRIVQ